VGEGARGVDGRVFPWGDGIDPSWCCMKDRHWTTPGSAPVEAFPVDASPYGVRGCGGNVREWCAEPFARKGPADGGPQGSLAVERRGGHRAQFAAHDMRDRPIRGGSWAGNDRTAQCAFRVAIDAAHRHTYLGLRPVRSVGPPR
jgi:eukaryotic-like serine/threonine-protein kinase